MTWSTRQRTAKMNRRAPLRLKNFYTLMTFRARHKIRRRGDFRLLVAAAAAALRQMPSAIVFQGLASWIGFGRSGSTTAVERIMQIELDYASLIACRSRPDSFRSRRFAWRAFSSRARVHRAHFRRVDPLRDSCLRQICSRLSLTRCRPDGARRCAVIMNRHRREYIGKILSEQKRPVYFVASKI